MANLPSDNRTRLIPLGFFVEFSKVHQYDGSIRDALGKQPEPYEEEIATYLTSGEVLIDVMEAVWDVIDRSRAVSGGSSLRTDGTYLWRLDLPYYVRKYHLWLNSNFLEHARVNNFKVPQLSDEQLDKLTQSAWEYF